MSTFEISRVKASLRRDLGRFSFRFVNLQIFKMNGENDQMMLGEHNKFGLNPENIIHCLFQNF